MPIGLNHNTEIIRPNEDSLIEIGAIYGSARSIRPTGFLLCDGSLVSRTIFSRLFNAIGTTYGSGDGSTTFAIPDLIGAVPRGAGTSIDYEQNVTVTLGSKQDDALQSFGVNYIRTDATIWYNGNTGYSWNDNPKSGQNNQYTTSATVTGSPRTTTETRMKNLGVNFFIKF